MNWSDKLQEFQAEMYGKLMDYLEKNGNQDDVRYDTDKDLIYFKVNDEWVEEYAVDIFDAVEIIDNLDIKCTF